MKPVMAMETRRTAMIRDLAVVLCFVRVSSPCVLWETCPLLAWGNGKGLGLPFFAMAAGWD